MNLLVITISILLAAVRYGSAYKWGDYPDCAKKRQSPINIDHDDTLMDEHLRLELHNFDKRVNMTLENNGHTAQVDIAHEGASISTTFENQTYEPIQFHFHWGNASLRSFTHGSEHTINGRPRAAELHIVHYNKKYGNISNALSHGDGLLVIGVFIESGASNPHLKRLTDNFHRITKPVSEHGEAKDVHDVKGVMLEDFALSDVLPIDALESFYHYDGSLTTPPCSEAVNWIVLDTPLTMDEAEFSEFRSLQNSANHTLSGNFREVQALEGRNVTRNFRRGHPDENKQRCLNRCLGTCACNEASRRACEDLVENMSHIVCEKEFANKMRPTE